MAGARRAGRHPESNRRARSGASILVRPGDACARAPETPTRRHDHGPIPRFHHSLSGRGAGERDSSCARLLRPAPGPVVPRRRSRDSPRRPAGGRSAPHWRKEKEGAIRTTPVPAPRPDELSAAFPPAPPRRRGCHTPRKRRRRGGDATHPQAPSAGRAPLNTVTRLRASASPQPRSLVVKDAGLWILRPRFESGRGYRLRSRSLAAKDRGLSSLRPGFKSRREHKK